MGRSSPFEAFWATGIYGKTVPPSVFLVISRYERLGVRNWDNERVLRLCHRLNLTLRELCATAGVFERKEAARYFRENVWPTCVTKTFCDLEEQYAEKLLGEKPMAILPQWIESHPQHVTVAQGAA